MMTPCKKKCVADWYSDRCLTCLRTRDEIANWLRISDAEREKIIAELPSRVMSGR